MKICKGLYATATSTSSHRPSPVGVAKEKASLGSNGDGVLRSIRSIAARKATASTISSALAIGDGTTAAEEELAIAAHTSASRAPGNAARLLADRAAGRTRNAPSASTT